MSEAGISDFAKDTVLSLLQEFFSNEKNAGRLVFNQSPGQSAIMIADKYTVNLEDVEKKPAIVVIRGTIVPAERGLDSFLGWTGPNTGEVFTQMLQATVNCTCMSRKGLEAEEIAWKVFAFFGMFRRRLREQVKGLHDIKPVALGEELAAMTDSDIDVSVVPVTLSMQFQWKWVLEQKSPALGSVDVKTYSDRAEAFTKFLNRAKPKAQFA